MQYHQDTFPVWEAMSWGRECPLCGLRRKTEQEEIERALGSSIMEPDVRKRVNELGICPEHHRMMYGQQNRLGHALLADSHLKNRQEKLEALRKRAEKVTANPPRLFTFPASNRRLAAELKSLCARCVVCDALETHMERYRQTFLFLWKTDDAFHTAWMASSGVCLPHVAELVNTAAQQLNRTQRNAFAAEALTLLTARLAADEQDLDWFTRKFDYRNQAEPWGESRTALERAVNRLRGWCLGDEPYPGKK